jgi:hypothetical protein
MVDLGGGSGRLPAIVDKCLISINMAEKLLKNVDFGGFFDITPRELALEASNGHQSIEQVELYNFAIDDFNEKPR